MVQYNHFHDGNIVKAKYRIRLPVLRQDAVPIPPNLFMEGPARTLQKASLDLGFQPVQINDSSRVCHQQGSIKPNCCTLGNGQVDADRDARHCILVLRIGETTTGHRSRRREFTHSVREVVEKRDCTWVLQVCPAQCE